MKIKSSFTKKIFRFLNKTDVFFSNEGDEEKLVINSVVNRNLNIKDNVSKFIIKFDNIDSTTRVYNVNPTYIDSVEYYTNLFNNNEYSIKLNKSKYENYLFSNKIILYAVNKYNSVIDYIEIKLPNTLEEIKEDFISNKIERLEKIKTSNNIHDMRIVNNNIVFSTSKSSLPSNSICTIFLNNKIFTKKPNSKGDIVFKKEDDSEIYDNIAEICNINKNFNIDYEISYKDSSNQIRKFSSTLNINSKILDPYTKKRSINKIKNNIKLKRLIKSDGNNVLSISYLNNKDLKSNSIYIKSINDISNKSIKIFDSKENKDKLSPSEVLNASSGFYIENNNKLKDITLKTGNIEFNVKANEILEESYYKEDIDYNNEIIDKNFYYKNLLEFYSVLSKNFTIIHEIDINKSDFSKEKFELKLGKFKKVAELFGYASESNDTTLDDEINFLKSANFVLEKTYKYKGITFDIKTKFFKIDDLFNFKEIKDNVLISDSNIDLSSNAIKEVFINNEKERFAIEKINASSDLDANELIEDLEDLRDFSIKVEYNLFAIPIINEIKEIKNKGFDNIIFNKNKTYVAKNPGNSDNIKSANKILNNFLDHTLIENYSFTKKEKIKSYFLSESDVIKNNTRFSKELVKNGKTINTEVFSQTIDINSIENKIKSSYKSFDKKNKKDNPKILLCNIFVENNIVKSNKNKKNNIGVDDYDVVIDITNTKLNTIKNESEVKIKYLFLSDLSNERDDVKNYQRIGKIKFYSNEYMKNNKNRFFTYFYNLEDNKIKIKNLDSKKLLCFNINKEYRLEKTKSKHKLLIEYTYTKQNKFIKYKNILDLD